MSGRVDLATAFGDTGGETSTRPELAARLHKRALAAAKAGRTEEAAHLWEESEALDPNWKYAFNQANLAMQAAQWMAA